MINKSHLSAAQIGLIELMQRVNYGRIESLQVHNGQPILDPMPSMVREIKFGGANGPRREIEKADFELKAEVRDLFAHFEEIGDGVIQSLEIQRGLPFRMSVEGHAA